MEFILGSDGSCSKGFSRQFVLQACVSCCVPLQLKDETERAKEESKEARENAKRVKEHEKQWEGTRETRVSNWRDYMKKVSCT
jgi:hypothetical protein